MKNEGLVNGALDVRGALKWKGARRKEREADDPWIRTGNGE